MRLSGAPSGRAGAVRRQTAREIASALTYLHQLDILHGDLSGGNILLASSNKDPRGFVAKARALPMSLKITVGGGLVSAGSVGSETDSV